MDENKDDIVDFLSSTVYVLDVFVKNDLYLVDEEYQHKIIQGFPQVKKNIQNAQKEISSKWPKYKSEMESMGLTGEQLDLKLTGFYKCKNRYLELSKKGIAFIRRIKKKIKKYIDVKVSLNDALKATLSWSLIIIGSLSAIPGLKETLELVKEFIESVKQALED